MEDIVVSTISQWGAVGILIAVAGYIIYDNWKKNKKNEEWYREHMNEKSSMTNCQDQLKTSLTNINAQLSTISSDNQKFRMEINRRVDKVEEVITKLHPGKHEHEAIRMESITNVAPAINSILTQGLNLCSVDHIALGLLHNGTSSLSGIPYIKMDIIAEKYKPIQFPEDVDLTSAYQSEDITKYNKLPNCILQSGCLELDIEKDGENISEIDTIVYNRCRNRGIKRLAFAVINDQHGLCNGCIIAYKFDSSPINLKALEEKAKIIQNLYWTMLDKFDSETPEF